MEEEPQGADRHHERQARPETLLGASLRGVHSPATVAGESGREPAVTSSSRLFCDRSQCFTKVKRRPPGVSAPATCLVDLDPRAGRDLARFP